MAKKFSVEAEFKAKDKVTAPVTRMQNKFGKNIRRMTARVDKFNRTANKMGRGAKRIGVGLTIVGVAALGMFTNIAKSGLDFEKAIAGVGAVSLKTRAEIAPLEAEARRLGRTTKFTATKSAEAMEILARSGFKMNNVLKATEPILLAATASGDGMAETAQNVVGVLKGMGLNLQGTIQGGRTVLDIGTEAKRVADVLARASSLTNSTMGSLGEGMSKVAFKAKALQIPLEDIVASVALMQDIGIDPAISGTAIKTMISKMAVPSDKIAAGMKIMGLSFKDAATGNFKTLPKLLEEINKATSKMHGNFDKTAFLVELVGMRGQIAAEGLSALFESGRLTLLTKALRDAPDEDIAKLMATLRMENAAGDLVILASAIDSVKISIFQLQSGPLRRVIQDMTEWVNLNEELIAQKVGETVAKIWDNKVEILEMAEHWAKVVGVVLALVVALKATAAVMTIIAALSTIATGGINIVVAAIIAAVAALVAWVVAVGGVEKAWDKFVDGAKAAIDEVKMMLSDFLKFHVISDFWTGLFSGDPELVAGGGGGGGGGGGAGGDGDDEGFGRRPSPGAGLSRDFGGLVTQSDRLATALAERRMTSELILRDETGRVEAPDGPLAPGIIFTQPSGAFAD